MEKQKICIIGGSLTGLATAICLSELDCEIDLVTGNLEKNLRSSRTIAVSENNLDFLNNHKIDILVYDIDNSNPTTKERLVFLLRTEDIISKVYREKVV